MRRSHILKPNHRNTYPYNCVWFDTEAHRHGIGSEEEHHTLAFGWALYRQRRKEDEWTEGQWLRFDRPDEFWHWIEGKARSQTTLYLWAHNMAYDGTLSQAWTTLPRRRWQLLGAVIDSPPFFVRLRKGAKTLILADTLNLWTTSLARIGEIVGLPKLDMPDHPPPSDEWDQYCRRDVEIIDAMCRRWWRWLRDQDMGQARITIAAQALAAFRHRHMTHKILVHDKTEALDLARKAYHGGRCEAWTIGALPGPTELWDVTSLYPYVMREWLYPVRLIGVYRDASIWDLKRAIGRYCLIAEVEVETEAPIYPYGGADKLTFPTGRFRTHLSTPELRWALECNSVRSVGAVAVYHPAFLFRSYIDHLWRLRADAKRRGDTFMDAACKLLMNSLYGKFGQRGYVDRIVDRNAGVEPKVWTEIDAETGQSYRMRQFMGSLVAMHQEDEAYESVPEIAAHVTAYGRMVLWDAIREVGEDRVHYMDTDSLLVDATASKPPGWGSQDTRLGAWTLRGTYDSGTIHGPKDYQFGAERRTKGVRANAEWLDPARVQQDQWLGLASLIRRGDVDHPRIQKITKVLQRVYDKGHVSPSGRVRPWCLPEESGRLLT